MTNHEAEEYTLSVRREVIEGSVFYVARVEELPDVQEFSESYEEARELALDTIRTSQAAYSRQGRDFPAPKSFDVPTVSGRVTLRLPKSVHAECLVNAENEGVSLNTYLLTCITSYRQHSIESVRMISADQLGLSTQLTQSFLAAFAQSQSHIKRDEFSLAIETRGSVDKVSFRDKLADLPLSCREIAASFNKVKFHNA